MQMSDSGETNSVHKGNMNFQEVLKQYWPIIAIALWFAHKWWKTKKVVALLPDLKKRGATFIDVRSPGEFANANAPGTINIPLPQLGDRLSEVPRSAPVVLCCASGTRSGMAKLLLKKNGYQEVHNVGTWVRLLN